jgi:hypothetical protein
MIKDYLGRVSVAAIKVLPKGDRLLFVGRTRAAIEAKVGPLASADADDVLSALTALGDPEDLAKRERERLYSARRRGAAAAPPTLWKPGKESRRGVVPPPPPAPPSRLVPFVPRQADSPEAAAPPAGPSSPADTAAPEAALDAAAAEGPAAGVPGNGQAGPGPGDPSQAGSSEDGVVLEGTVYDGPAGAAPEPGGTPPGWMRPRPTRANGETTPLSIVPGMEQPADAEDPPLTRRRPLPAPIAEAWALARKHPLEAVSVILLGVGGLIFPFPFWLIGGLVALRSRRWDARDKWVALAGPLLVTLAVLVIRAGTSPGNFFPAFYHAAQHDFGLSIRAGCVLCAGYLVWRLRRGPRLRTLPPWQRPR